MEEGGSPVRRRRAPPQQHHQPPPMDPGMDFYDPNSMNQRVPPPPPPEPVISKSSFKSRFGSGTSSDSFKYSLLVAVIFILLNSKIIWTQIMKFPGMGTMEPSIIALVVNGLLAAMAFFVVHSFLMK